MINNDKGNNDKVFGRDCTVLEYDDTFHMEFINSAKINEYLFNSCAFIGIKSEDSINFGTKSEDIIKFGNNRLEFHPDSSTNEISPKDEK